MMTVVVTWCSERVILFVFSVWSAVNNNGGVGRKRHTLWDDKIKNPDYDKIWKKWSNFNKANGFLSNKFWTASCISILSSSIFIEELKILFYLIHFFHLLIFWIVKDIIFYFSEFEI